MIALLLLATTPVDVPKLVAKPFPLSRIRVTGGPFAQSHTATSNYLLELDPERLLSGFRANSGLTPKAQIYGGWETGGLSGHSLGHYLTACAQEFAQTGDIRFKQKVDQVVSGLVECQRTRPDGFLSAFRFDRPSPDGRPAGFDRERLDKIWADVSEGKLRSGGFDLNGMWSPWYVHHKVFAGLLDAHSLCGSKDALAVAEKFAGWAHQITKNLTPEQWQTMLGTEYGGMNESMAELYARTKNSTYLDLARKFYDYRVLEPLSKLEDNLAGKHSNTQIPKLIGLARLYELTGEQKDRKTAAFFWDRVVNHHSYAIGGNSNGEYLGPPDRLADRLSTNTAETCNTYNMLKLTRHVFSWGPTAAHMDFYERAYWNHILASQDPKTGMVTYFVPLSTGSSRGFSNKFDSFTCCHGSGMENHTKHGDSAYFHDGSKALWVNLFMPTELDFKEAGVKIRQVTSFPFEKRVALEIVSGKPSAFEIKIRHPAWAKGSIDFLVNGKSFANSKSPGTYVNLKRTWRPGDHVEFTLPMQLRTESMPDNPKRIAIMYGPLVLGADLGPAVRRGRSRNTGSPTTVIRTPVLLDTGRSISEWLKPVSGKPLTFSTQGTAEPDELTFSPFYSLYHQSVGVYFDLFTPSEWKAMENEYRAEEERIRDIESRTVDYVTIGEMQPERDHNLKSERNDVRDVNGRNFRTAMAGGWFEFEMKVNSEGSNALVMTYWGNDRLRPDFALLIDGKQLSEENLRGRPANKFFDVEYGIPPGFTAGKPKVVVRVQPKDGKSGPSVAGARIIRAKT